MTKRGLLLTIAGAVVALAALGVGGYFFVEQRIKGQIEDGLRELAANPPAPYSAFAFASVDFSLRERRVVVTGLKAEQGNGDRMSLGRIEVDKFDIEVWQNVVDSQRYGATPDQTFRRLFDKAVVTDLSAVRAGQAAKADKLTVAEVDIRQLSPPPNAATFRALSEAERLNRALSAMRVGSIVLENLSATPEGRETFMARIAIDALDGERFSSLVIDRLEQEQPDGKITLGRFELVDGLSAAWLNPAADRDGDAVWALLDFSSAKMVDLRKRDPQTDVAVVIKSVDIGKTNSRKLNTFAVNDIEISSVAGGEPFELSIEAVELADVDWEQLLPIVRNTIARMQKDPDSAAVSFQAGMEEIGNTRFSLGTFALKGIDFGNGVSIAAIHLGGASDNGAGKFDLSVAELVVEADELQDEKVAAALAAAGYDRLELTMRMQVSGDRQKGLGALERLEINGTDIGTLNLSYAVSNYRKPTRFTADAMAPLLDASLDRAEIAWKDDGLTQRLLAAAAQQNRTSVASLKTGLVAQLRQAMAPYQNAPRVRQTFEAAIRYLAKPGSIVVSAKPARPAPIKSLAALLDVKPGTQPDIAGAFDLLEITAATR